MSETPRPVDELRQRLRELGYLDAGVDRFVLAPVGRGRSSGAAAAWASLRIGLLGAWLLGPLAAVTLGARLPELVVGLRDWLVLAVYLSAVFLVAITALAWLAVTTAGIVVARRGGGPRAATRAAAFARGAGAVVGVSMLVYLVFWWRGTGGGGAWQQPWGTVLALLVAAGLSVFLGHSVSIAAHVVMAQRSGEPDPILGRRRRSRQLAMLAWIGAFAGAAALLQVAGTWSASGEDAVEAAPALEVRSDRLSAVIVCLDGFDQAFAERLAAGGHLPVFASLLAGARADLASEPGVDPAAAWTSIATGQPVAIHGVRGVESRRVSGLTGEVAAGGGAIGRVLAAATDRLRLTRQAASSGWQRRAKAFWEVAGEQGLHTGTVNWWASWPAPEQAGLVLSDRATLRLDLGGRLDAEIAPPSLYDELRQAWPDLRRAARRRAAEAFAGEAEPAGGALRRGAEQDLLQLALADRIGGRADDLLVVYLPGLDIAQYALVSGPSAAGLPASALAARVESLGRYYPFLDRLVGEFLSSRRAWRLHILLADPGRSRTSPPGVLAVRGDAAQVGARVEARRLDVAPTLLHWLGLPVSDELGGRVIDVLLSRGSIGDPVRRVPTYGRRRLPPMRQDGTPIDDAALERLRSLGYIR